MSKTPEQKRAREIQKHFNTSYSTALRVVREVWTEAKELVETQGISRKDAFLQLAKERLIEQ